MEARRAAGQEAALRRDRPLGDGLTGADLADPGLTAAVLAVRLRDLPWRRTRDPWAVTVAELMLQQTQVARVVPRYQGFLHRFPSAAACAAEPVGAVIESWHGLGYNRRAVHLHAAATAVVARHGGAFPDRLADLLALPGIGPYTARAVLAFAYEADGVAVVDTNVARLLGRLLGTRLAMSSLQRRADAMVPPGRSWRWNQAVMELGATVCTARAPRCEVCPVRPWCRWAAAGRPDPDPGAARTTQSRFEGSDRQGRGRLVAALRSGPVALGELAAVMGWPDDPDRAGRVAAGVVDDGLAVRCDGWLRLP